MSLLIDSASARIVLAKGQPVPNDPYLYTNTVLLLHGDGTNGSTTILDSSKVVGSPKTVTAVGNAQISTAQSKFGGASIAFDGSGDNAQVANSNDFSLSTDFTIECWTYFNQLTNSPSVWCLGDARAGNNGLLLYWSAGSKTLRVLSDGSVLIASGTSGLTTTTWQHIAVVRSGSGANNLVIYVNGVNRGQVTNLTVFVGVGGNGFTLGAQYAGSFFPSLDGYIDDLRITKGVARYTANFTPPTAPFPDF